MRRRGANRDASFRDRTTTEGETMTMKMGDTYTCSNSECGCQVQVTRSAKGAGGDQNPRCCCGAEMKAETAVTRTT